MIFDDFLFIYRFWGVFYSFFWVPETETGNFVMEDFFGGATKYKKITD
jgi:hypothetical protein